MGVMDLALTGSSVWAITGCDDRYPTCPAAVWSRSATTGAWTRLQHQPPVTSGPFKLIAVSASTVYVVQQSEMEARLIRTTDGGTTWARLNIPCPRGFTGMPVATLDGVHIWIICPSEPGAGEQAKWTYTSDDSGSHWTLRAYDDGIKSSGAMPIAGYAHLLALSSSSTGVMANDRGDVYRSIDHGRTWTDLRLAFASEGFYSALQFVDASTGWLSGVIEGVTPDGAVGLYRTTDGGATWKLVSSMSGNAN